jgi:glycerophosphoryl diester phosphodiesterase
MGADYIEPDLVPTKDGVLVARHEPEISGTTDVAAKFPDRKKTKTIDGQQVTGWFTEDFTLAELKTLRAVERLPAVRQHNTIYNGRFEVPTFQEVLDLRRRLSRELHRDIGVYPETKHPSYFTSIGLDTTPMLVKALRGQNKVFIQSFEDGNLRELHRDGVKFPLIQLLTLDQPYDPADVATYADGVGPDKSRVTKAFVDEAHAHNLLVHAWVLRAEDDDMATELRRLAAAGVDGVFTDHPDIAVEARDRS